MRFSLQDFRDSEEFKFSKKKLVLEILAHQRSGYTREVELRRQLKELNWKSGMPHGAFIDDRGDPVVENEKDLMKHPKEELVLYLFHLRHVFLLVMDHLEKTVEEKKRNKWW